MDENVRVTNPPSPEQIAAMTEQVSEMPLVYYNYARATGSFFDIRLFFGQSSITPQGQAMFQEQVCIVMSPEFAKILRDSLSTSITAYEEKFGTLRQAPTLAAATDSAAPAPNGGKKKRK